MRRAVEAQQLQIDHNDARALSGRGGETCNSMDATETCTAFTEVVAGGEGVPPSPNHSPCYLCPHAPRAPMRDTLATDMPTVLPR